MGGCSTAATGEAAANAVSGGSSGVRWKKNLPENNEWGKVWEAQIARHIAGIPVFEGGGRSFMVAFDMVSRRPRWASVARVVPIQSFATPRGVGWVGVGVCPVPARQQNYKCRPSLVLLFFQDFWWRATTDHCEVL